MLDYRGDRYRERSSCALRTLDAPTLHVKHLQASEAHLLRLKHITIESGAHFHTEEPPEAPSMHVKEIRAYEAPFPLEGP